MTDELRKRDPDMENSFKALVRASKKARELAARTQTEFVVYRDGKLISEIPKLEDIEKFSDSDETT